MSNEPIDWLQGKERKKIRQAKARAGYGGTETSVVTDILIKIAVYQVSPCLNPCQSILPYNGDQNT